ncbi:MAG: ATP-binding protein, partial [Myxococcota bacterium]
LRGFVSLIEPRLNDERADRNALDGLRAAIDDLERLARLTLQQGAPVAGSEPSRRKSHEPGAAEPASEDGRADIPEAVRRALSELRNSHPGVSWETRTDGSSPRLTIPESSFSETLVILLRNAVEAMHGQGRGLVETSVEAGDLHVRIGDEGPGLQGVDLAEIFKPGFTTKQGGSGYGLFLARRIIEEHGGSVEAGSRPDGGALFEIVLPEADEVRSKAAR